MEDTSAVSLNTIRLSIFFGLLFLFIAAEFIFPWRKRRITRSQRWLQNLVLTISNTVVARLTLGTVPLMVSYWVAEQQIGLLQLWELPVWLVAICTYVLLDLMIYLQHLMFHATPLLWRLHKVHHSDPDLDVTSGFRFHPMEIILSLAIKTAGIMVLGANPLGVMIFEILLNAGSLFNHSNMAIPPPIEKVLRWVLVTPKVHLIHHSTEASETNSNFGFTISLWDRIFGTFRNQPGPKVFTIGLTEYPDPDQLGIGRLLVMPFENKSQSYSLSSTIHTLDDDKDKEQAS